MPIPPLRPDFGDGTFDAPAIPAGVDSAVHGGGWAWIAGAVDAIPAWAWPASIGVLTLATILLIPFLRAHAFKAGRRASGATSTGDQRDRRLLIAALIPATLFWVAVLLGSGRGLVAFGREDLHWTGGWEFLVPATLDGVAISFALLAFRAVRKEINPDRATRIAWLSMLSSAGLNFLHEVGGSKIGAGYLAILSLLGMLIFHEFLAQFEEGTQWIQRKNPKFGLRWLTWPTNTVCAWLGWQNHPVEDGVNATVRAAVDHLDAIRRRKAAELAARVDAPAWWMALAPWARITQLGTALSERRAELESAALRSAELADRITGLERARSEDRAANAATVEQIKLQAAEHIRRMVEQIRAETAEQIRSVEAERDVELARMRAEHDGKLLRLQRNAATSDGRSAGPTRKNGPERTPAPPARMSDTEALAAMFAEHPEPGYAWTDREVNRITGAGFSSRAPRLTGMATTHLADCPEQSHRTCYSERSDGGSVDDKEQAS